MTWMYAVLSSPKSCLWWRNALCRLSVGRGPAHSWFKSEAAAADLRRADDRVAVAEPLGHAVDEMRDAARPPGESGADEINSS